jgi:hypothetical protein
MSTPGPYRTESNLKTLIAPDRRPLVAALVGSIIGALVGSTVTLALVRERPTTTVMVAAPDMLPQHPAASPGASAETTAATTCSFDLSSGVAVTRDPLPELPRFPPAVVRSVIGDVQTNTASVVLETCAPFSEVLAFYRAPRGLVLDGETSGEPHQLTYTTDNPKDEVVRSFVVSLERVGAGTRIRLGAGIPRRRR